MICQWLRIGRDGPTNPYDNMALVSKQIDPFRAKIYIKLFSRRAGKLAYDFL